MADNDVNVNIKTEGAQELNDSLGSTKDLASGVSDEFGLMNTQVGRLAKGIMSFGKAGVKAMTSLKGAIISTGIGALVIAVVALISYFTKTEEGANRLKVIMAVLGQVVDGVVDIFVKLGKKIFELKENFTSFGDVIKNLGEKIIQNLKNRLTAILDIFKALGKILKGDFKKGLKDLADGVIQVTTGITDGTDKLAKMGKKLVENTQAMIALAKAAGVLQDRQNKLNIAQREWLVDGARLEVALSEARAGAGDAMLTYEERIKSMTNAQEINNQIFDERIRLAKEQYEIAKAQNALSSSTSEDMQVEAEAQATLIRLEAERNNVNREFHNQAAGFRKTERDALIARKEKAKQDAVDEITRQQTVNDELRLMAQEHEFNLLEDKNQADLLRLEQEKINFEIELERRLSNEEITQAELLKIRQKFNDSYALSVQIINDQIEKDNAETAIANVDIAAFEAQAKIDGALTAANALLGAANAVFGETKGAAIAGTIISTYQSATSAFGALAGIPVIGPALGGIAAGAAILTGLANVNKIRQESKSSSQEIQRVIVPNQNPQFGGGGDIYGASHSVGGVNINAEEGEYMVNKLAMKGPNANIVRDINETGGANYVTMQQAIDLINAQEVYITETKITKKQKDVAIRESTYIK